jgi:hypothetical protein
MPEISRFFGVVVRMLYRDHVPPHFHVQYGGRQARFALGPVRWIEGRLPPRVIGLIMEWALIHEDELLEDWDLAQHNRPLKRIEPLE